MAYIATRKVNTAFGSYEVGEIVSDSLGERYSAFEKVEEEKVQVKAEPKPTKKAKKEKKEEILTEVSEPVQVEVTEE